MANDLKALRKALDQKPEQLIARLEQALKEEAEAIEADAKDRVRVDDGDLRDIIAAEVNGLEATVAPRPERSKVDPQRAAIKANVNEFGRKSDPGQPFMTPAAEAARARWVKRATDAAKKALED